jgi:hypothetical protein
MDRYITASFVPNIYTYLVFLVGVYIAISRRRKHPLISLYTTIAIGISFNTLLAIQVRDALLGYYVAEEASNALPLIIQYGKYIAFTPYLNVLMWALLFFSIFGWRKSQQLTEEITIKK